MAAPFIDEVKKRLKDTNEWAEYQRLETRGGDGSFEYRKLQEETARIIDAMIPKVNKKEKTFILNASSFLLHEKPSLRSKLKVMINIPLPVSLRKSAWSAFLQNNSIKQEFLLEHSGKEMKDFKDIKVETVQNCNQILQSKKLPEFKKLSNLTHEYYFIVNFWKRKNHSEEQLPLLLCLPFLYLFSDTIKPLHWPTMATVYEVFHSFVDLMPLSMRDINDPTVSSTHISCCNVLYFVQNYKALLIMFEEVTVIFHNVDPAFVKELRKIFQSEDQKSPKSFHQHLADLVHPFLQRIFICII
jgi:hypothetical protein